MDECEWPHRTNKFKWRMLQKWISCTFIDEIVTQLKGGWPEPGLPLEKLQHVEGNWHATDLILPSIFAMNWVLCGSHHTCRFLTMWGGIPMHVNESKHQLHTTYGKSKHNAFFFNKIFTDFFPSTRTISLVLDKFHVYDKVVLGHMHLFTHLIQSCCNYFVFTPYHPLLSNFCTPIPLACNIISVW